mgnify:FL=1
MARGVSLKNNLTKEILFRLVQAGTFAVAATSPYFLHQLIKTYFQEKSREIKRKITRRLKELEKRKVVEFKELGNGTVKITLTHLGQKIVRQYNLENIQIKKPKKWDGKWRIIIYDIPIAKKKAANAFRQKIRDLGLYQLQKSIWISPYDCLNEIEFLCDVFEIDVNSHLFYFKTAEMPKEKEVRQFFS